jgi:hypothetical protein
MMSSVGKFIKDVQDNQKNILICMGLAIVYCIFYVYAMSNFANCIVMTAVLLVEVCLIGGAVYSFLRRDQKKT